MKIATESLEGRQLSLTIEIDEERARRAKQRAARRVSKEVKIPGFREGKAPYEVIAQRYGEHVLQQELVEMLAENAYREALEQEEIIPYAPGTLEETVSAPLAFRFTIPLPPKVEPGDYRSYRLEPPEVEVAEEDVQQALEEIREQNAILAPVDRPAALGDVVVVDLVGRTSEGETLLDQEEARILLDAESGEPLPGLIEAIVGMEEGEERTSTLVLPEDFRQEELRGEGVELTIELRAVYERILPQLDDDLARTVGNFDSFEELESRVRERLAESARAEAERAYREQVLEDIISQADVEYPPIMLEEAIDDTVEEYGQVVRSQEHLMLDDYLRIQGKTMDDLREELEPGVAASLERSLVLSEVVRREGLEVSEGEIEAQIERSSAEWGERSEEVRAALDTEEGRREMSSRVLANKAVERLVAIAKGEAPELTPVEEAEAPGEPEPED